MTKRIKNFPCRVACAGVVWALVGAVSMTAQAGNAVAVAGCTLKKQFYTCDRVQFQSVLAAARTVQVEAGARDKMAAAKLRELATSFGKSLSTTGEPVDLVFSLIPLDSDGVLIGPSGTELAVLRIYGPPIDGARGNLLWAETYFGQPDMSWPAVVQSVVQQFRAGFKR